MDALAVQHQHELEAVSSQLAEAIKERDEAEDAAGKAAIMVQQSQEASREHAKMLGEFQKMECELEQANIAFEKASGELGDCKQDAERMQQTMDSLQAENQQLEVQPNLLMIFHEFQCPYPSPFCFESSFHQLELIHLLILIPMGFRNVPK